MASSDPLNRPELALDDSFPEEEAQRRFEALVKAALNTPPKPLKDVPRKRTESKGKAKKNV